MAHMKSLDEIFTKWPFTEHDFHGSSPEATSRIEIIATVTDFPRNDPQHNTAWFGLDRGVEK